MNNMAEHCYKPPSICIIGYGNIGKHLAEELKGLEFDIRDTNIPEYSTFDERSYRFAFVCVPTDMLPDGSCDIACVEDAVSHINADIIVIKSAIPVGTAECLAEKFSKSIVVSPEFYGTTIHAPKKLDWLILGGNSGDCSKVAQLFYKVKGSSFRVRFTDWRTAELTKYAENCFLAMRVVFFSEFSKIAQLYGINYEEFRECIIMDERIGDSHSFVFSEQPYFNSHCLNKDTVALIRQGGKEAKLMRAVYEVNLMRKLGVDSLDGVKLPYINDDMNN